MKIKTKILLPKSGTWTIKWNIWNLHYKSIRYNLIYLFTASWVKFNVYQIKSFSLAQHKIIRFLFRGIWCSSYPCQNGGTCVDISNGFTCICPAGMSGTLCETSKFQTNITYLYVRICLNCFCKLFIFLKDINECASFPCQNGGTCRDFVNGFTCSCPPGTSGPLCEISQLNFLKFSFEIFQTYRINIWSHENKDHYYI